MQAAGPPVPMYNRRMSTQAPPSPNEKPTTVTPSSGQGVTLNAAFAGIRRVPEPVNEPNYTYAPGTPARLRQTYQRGQAEHLRLVGQQLGKHQSQVQRLGGQRFDRRAARSELPVDRIGAVDGFQHRGQPLGEVVAPGQHERDAGVADAFLGPHQPLRHGRRFDRERSGDRGGLDTQHRLQHQRGTNVRRDGGMSTDQHQLEPPVGNGGHVVFQRW